MNAVKTWIITKSDLDQSDFSWLKGAEMHVWVEQPETRTFTTAGGGYYQYMADPVTILAETTTEKQEVMLKLKYGESLILRSIETYIDDFSPCVLEGIKWS